MYPKRIVTTGPAGHATMPASTSRLKSSLENRPPRFDAGAASVHRVAGIGEVGERVGSGVGRVGEHGWLVLVVGMSASRSSTASASWVLAGVTTTSSISSESGSTDTCVLSPSKRRLRDLWPSRASPSTVEITRSRATHGTIRNMPSSSDRSTFWPFTIASSSAASAADPSSVCPSSAASAARASRKLRRQRDRLDRRAGS